METTVLSAADVAECLKPEDAIEAVQYVLNEWGKGNIVMPAKITLDMSRSAGESWSNAMPAYVVSRNAAGIKWIGGYKTNAKRGMPYIMGVIVLTDPETGQTLAIMDGKEITNMRTGASAAVSARYLAGEELQTIAIIGAGVQGRTSVTCLHHFYPSAQVRIADISAERRKTFQSEMSRRLGMDIVEAQSAAEAIRGADLVVLVTTAESPFVRDEWITEGATVLGMGSSQQIEDAFALSADKIVVDCWAQAGHRGELKNLTDAGKISETDIYAKLGDIVAGSRPGRQTSSERILMVPVGLGAYDICIVQEVFLKASRKGLGQMVKL